MSRNAAWRDAHDPRLGELVGTAIESKPVTAQVTQPVAHRRTDPDPYERMLDDGLRVRHINRIRRHPR